MTEDPAAPAEATLFPKTVGERLRDARIAQQLELTDIAARTRIPLRQLQAIEDGDYSQMPTPTYAVGFAKAYARVVGEDEVAVAREVRGASEQVRSRTPEYQPYETDDASKTPSRGVLIGAALVALLVVVAVGLWYGTGLFRGDGLAGPAPVAAPPSIAPEPEPSAMAVAAGQVTLIATDEVWLRVYDATGQTLLQKTLAKGERYEVPADAAGPMINVGRPEKLQVLLNGSEVAPLGDGSIALKDVGINAAALAARGQPQATATETSAPAASTPAAAAAPAARSSTRPRPVPPAFRTPTTPTASPVPPTPVGPRATLGNPVVEPSPAAAGNSTM